MTKCAIMLLLLGATAILWQQAEAKPFFILPANFFVLTTRAPSTSSPAISSRFSSASSSTSSGLFQLPIAIISQKLSFITNKLTGFGGGAGGSGGIGVGFGVGATLNAGTTTRRPKTTTEPSSNFTPEVTTNVAKITTTTTNPETSALEQTIATTTELPSIDSSTTTSSIAPESIEGTIEVVESNKPGAVITVEPTILPQRPALLTAAASDLESTIETAKKSGGVISNGYGYVSPHLDSDNEISHSNVNKMYLPAQNKK